MSTTTTKNVTTTASHVHKKTCIDVEELKKVDESVVLKGMGVAVWNFWEMEVSAGTKKGTIEVSVELGDGDNSDDSSEEEEPPVRHVRENKKPTVVCENPCIFIYTLSTHISGKKFEMNCDEEEDEKGKICKVISFFQNYN